MKTLNIVKTAYRATSEEQDDTIVWFVHTLRNGGADVDLLLCGNAVNYGVRFQQAVPMKLGAWCQSNPPQPAEDLAHFVGKGGQVYVVSNDLAERGIVFDQLLPQLHLVARHLLPDLFERYARVWSW